MDAQDADHTGGRGVWDEESGARVEMIFQQTT